MIPVPLLEHNIERATGLTVGAGRAKRSVTLAISGTSGQLTVDAAELVEAVLDIMSRPPVRAASASTRKNKQKVAVSVRQDGQNSPAVNRPVKRQSTAPKGNLKTRTSRLIQQSCLCPPTARRGPPTRTASSGLSRPPSPPRSLAAPSATSRPAATSWGSSRSPIDATVTPDLLLAEVLRFLYFGIRPRRFIGFCVEAAAGASGTLVRGAKSAGTSQ